MTPQAAEAFALSLPGTFMVVQWMGSHVMKVGTPDKNQMFAVFAGEGEERVTLKCADDETARFLIEIGAATKAPHLPRGGWIALSVPDVGDEELRERLQTSYATVRATLPKGLQATLG